MTQPISLLLCALGGEGGGTLTDWLVDTARRAGHAAQATSIPGVAQRTGATTYYLEVFPVPLAELGGRRPVFGLNPLPGRLDALVSSELLETGRQIGNGMASCDHTLVITSSSRALTTAEKMVMGDGRRDDTQLLALVREHSRAHHVLDMARLTREAGTVVSAVMLGAIAASGVLPFPRADFESVVREGGHGAASLRGFSLAFEVVTAQRTQGRWVEQVMADEPPAAPHEVHTPAAALAGFPVALHDIVALGHARVVSYQNEAYGGQYLDRLQRVLSAERAGDPAGSQGLATTREVARWLALWMAFDDIIRVAELKARAARAERVRREVKAGEGDLLRVFDHFKPGAPEFAALLPPPLANRVLAWDHRRVQRGKLPWALPLKVSSHGVFGLIALRALAACKRLRPAGSRFATEQALIERWLEAVTRGAQADAALGLELARCGRLIKGYGSTNERGKDNLLHVIDHLGDPAREGAALAVAQARQAALADEAGTALDRALVQHGAPARPIKPQPVRWQQNPRLKKQTP